MNKIFDVSKLQRAIHRPLVWGVILMGFSAPISVAVDNILMALIFLGALFSLGGIKRIVVTHPIARAAMLLFFALFVAMFYGVAPMKEALDILGKYADLAFVAIYIFLLVNETDRRRARYAFIAAMALTLVLSYLVGLGLMPAMSWMSAGAVPANPAIFHNHDTQNNFMAFAIFLGLLEWREAVSHGKKIAWAAFSLMGCINILFMVQGRGGYLVLFVLLGWFVWTTLGRELEKRGKHISLSHGVFIVCTLLAVAITTYYSSARFHDRVARAVTEFQEWDHSGVAATLDSSTGLRLDFYSNTLKIVQDNLIFGVGAGGFPAAYEKETLGKNAVLTRNPHDEFLMIAAQTGIIGLVLLLYLFYTEWRCAPLLPGLLEQDAARGLVIAYIVNCLFNSALMDHSDGLFFAFMSAVLFSNLKIGDKRA